MDTQITLPKYVSDFMAVFNKAGYEIYVVGGAVRDLLLSPTSKVINWDFTSNAKPDEIQKLFAENFYHNEYGTVSVPIQIADQKLVFEITPFRKESNYSDTRHPDSIEWAKTIEEDLSRRDFTINAIAYDGSDIIDHFNGKADIEKKIIRTVSDPNKRFSEDALRLLRAIRFSSELGFTVEKLTLKAIIRHTDAIRSVSWERIRDEFLKILSSPHPAEGILLLRQTKLLSYILPELEACFGVEQKSPHRHHIYDVGTHLVETLRHCPSTDTITRLAALIHDIGKAQTMAKDEKSGTITFYNHEIVGAHQTAKIADRLRLSKEQKDKLIKLVRYHMFSVSEHQTDKAIRRTIRNVGKEYINDLLTVRIGDRLGSGAKETSWRTQEFKKRLVEVQKVPFCVRDLKIDGNDVMKELGIKPGPKVGEVMKAIFEEVDDGKLKNTRPVLLKKLEKFKSI